MRAMLLLQALGLLTILAGIAYRDRWRACRTWPLYLGVGAGHNLLQCVGLATTWQAWVLVELTQKTLWLLVALEIASKVFHAGLPGGRTRLARGLSALLVVGLTLMVAHTPPGDALDVLMELARRTGVLASWAGLMLLIACALWRWPIHPYHRDILLGGWLYQAAFSLFGDFGRVWPVWLYSILIVYWAVSAWRPSPRVDWPAKLRAATWPWEPAP